MAVNMKRRFDGDDSSQEPERKRSAQAYDPLFASYPASGWCGELIRRVLIGACHAERRRCDAMATSQPALTARNWVQHILPKLLC